MTPSRKTGRATSPRSIRYVLLHRALTIPDSLGQLHCRYSSCSQTLVLCFSPLYTAHKHPSIYSQKNFHSRSPFVPSWSHSVPGDNHRMSNFARHIFCSIFKNQVIYWIFYNLYYIGIFYWDFERPSRRILCPQIQATSTFSLIIIAKFIVCTIDYLVYTILWI